MDANARKMAEDAIDRAGRELHTARERAKSYFTYADAVHSAQISVELAVKAVATLLGLEFPRAHELKPDTLKKLAGVIRERKLIEKIQEQNLHHQVNLPRLFFLVNFWSEFYLLAKYGMQTENLATASELFKREEADIAVVHAAECLDAANILRHLPEPEMSRMLA